MNAFIWEFLRAGFPLLLLIVFAMILISVWRNEQDSREQKIRWTVVLLLPPLLSLGLFILQSVVTIENLPLAYVLSGAMLFLPILGIFVWLVGSR
ncbi:MAG: hypothetical protein AAFR61_30935 [Bacteroidota bacterium]